MASHVIVSNRAMSCHVIMSNHAMSSCQTIPCHHEVWPCNANTSMPTQLHAMSFQDTIREESVHIHFQNDKLCVVRSLWMRYKCSAEASGAPMKMTWPCVLAPKSCTWLRCQPRYQIITQHILAHAKTSNHGTTPPKKKSFAPTPLGSWAPRHRQLSPPSVTIGTVTSRQYLPNKRPCYRSCDSSCDRSCYTATGHVTLSCQVMSQ